MLYPRIALVLVIAVAGALAVRGVMTFTPALNDPSPPLAREAPLVEPPAASALARRVVIVLVDGLREDAAHGKPTLDALRARGVDIPTRAPYPTISKANYVTVGSGVRPRFSGARTNDGFRLHTIDSVFGRMRAAGRPTAYVADRTQGLARLFGIEARKVSPLGGGLTAAFTDTLARNELVLMKFMEVDMAGHAHGADSSEYADAVRAVDTQLGQLLANFDFTRDAVIVVADHGHTDRGGHGGLGDAVERVPFLIAGAGVVPGVIGREASLEDVAPTAAALLGLSAPGHALGRAVVEALAFEPAQRAAIAAVDARRHAHLAPILERIAAADAAAAAAAWHVRLPLALAVIGLLVFVLRRWLDRPAVLWACVFPLLFGALVFAVDRLFALPSVPASRVSTWGLTAIYGGIAALVWIAIVVHRRRELWSTLAAALCVGSAPALLAWALAGPAFATQLPRTELLLLAPYSYAALAYLAAATLLALPIALAMRRAR